MIKIRRLAKFPHWCFQLYDIWSTVALCGLIV